MEKEEKLAEYIKGSKNIVAFTGAGASTESNIPDFRSSGGVYDSIRREYGRPAEMLLSHSFFIEHPDIFYDYLNRFLLHPDAVPNAAHRVLAALEKEAGLKLVITQNIDGLHTQAGSRQVCELHGSLFRTYCMRCGRETDPEWAYSQKGVPFCEACGGIIRPDIVLYEETLNPDVIDRAIKAISEADLLLVIGTSLAVYPAAGLLRYFKGSRLALINKSPTPYDSKADLVIGDAAGSVLARAAGLLGLSF